MITKSVEFSGKNVRVSDGSWPVDHPISEACLIDDVVIVIYDYMSGPRDRQFQNMEGFDVTGRKLWTAEHPTSATNDAYVSFMNQKPLVAWNYACYRCTINPATGKLLTAVFTK